MVRPYVLCILDGWGEATASPYNAISMAKTPVWDRFKATYPHTTLDASGLTVGLPDGQMGNSEVGHMAIGAGRVIFQDLPRIDQAIQSGTLEENPVLKNLISILRNNKSVCHLLGLLSPGGVHSHSRHLLALTKMLSKHEISVRIHGFLDGRDTPPQSALRYCQSFLKDLEAFPKASIATLGGRYYGMDRDKRWERIEKAYQAIAYGHGKKEASPLQAIQNSYDQGVTDEFMIPVVCGDYAGIHSDDALLMANFRADRVRQLLTAFVDPHFKEFSTHSLQLGVAVGITSYSKTLDPFMSSLFLPQEIKHSLGEIISEHKLTQLRIAETEKYAHVTFFFNGGREEPFSGEDRILIPSPKVATYDQQPEMSALEMTKRLVNAIHKEAYDLIVVNYANTDMVGHTGNLQASIKAVETVDMCLGLLERAVKEKNGVLIITADHGNVESLMDEGTHTPHTAHTHNPVPFLVVGENLTFQKLHPGKLTDIAPSILRLMGVRQPREMSGHPLFDDASQDSKRVHK